MGVGKFAKTSWQENLGSNSTIALNQSIADSPLNSILRTFGIKPNDPSATFDVTRFGNFTANFKPIPPPDILVVTLFSVIATAFIGSWTFIGSVVGRWTKAKKQGSRLEHYHNKIKKVHDIQELDKLREDITDGYATDNITKEQFEILRDMISISHGEILTKQIESFNNNKLSENDKIKKLSTIMRESERENLTLDWNMHSTDWSAIHACNNVQSPGQRF